jgi:pimeloyl-ACP methyl ester carboxylesterase
MLEGGGRRARRFLTGVLALANETTLLDDLRRTEDIADDVLARLAMPLLAVYGARSSVRRVGDRLARVVPGAELVELAGGHFLPIESPHALTPVLAGFLDG